MPIIPKFPTARVRAEAPTARRNGALAEYLRARISPAAWAAIGGEVPQQQSHLERIAKRFNDWRRTGDSFMACCPAHDDSNASLHISEGKGGRILVYCHARCSLSDVLALAGLRMADLMPGAELRPRIVATYDYRDEERELLYQSVRMEPKSFRQRRPDGKAGWSWNTQGVRKVLYHLPELLAAKPCVLVFVVEGEKDADRLTALGLLATTNINGAGKWLESYTEALRDRQVVVLPDNDESGRDHAEQVATSLHGTAASVKVVSLPDLPDRGDVSDWLDAGGTRERLLVLVEQAAPFHPIPNKPNECEPLEPLGLLGIGSIGAVPPFPVHVLPEKLRRHASSIAAALPCPIDFVGVMMLPVLGTFIGRRRQIAVRPDWVESARIWAAVVAPSGEKKSPAFTQCIQPLQRVQEHFLVEYREQKKEYQALSAEDRKEAPSPKLRQVLTTNSTVEGLRDVLANNPWGVAFAADELSGWASSHNQYKGGKGDDRQAWLSLWSGETVVVNRATLPEPVVIVDPFVNVVGGIQPDALCDVIDDARQDGFSPRVLFSFPDELPDKSWTGKNVEGGDDYLEVCRMLWSLPPSKEPVKFGLLSKSIFIRWYNQHERERPPDHLGPVWAKCTGYCLRLTLILSLSRWACEGGEVPKLVKPQDVEGAIELISYFKSHAARVYGVAADKKDDGRISRFIRWARKQEARGKKITANLAQMNGVCGVRTAEDAKRLLRDAAACGHGRAEDGDRNSVSFAFHDTRPMNPMPNGSNEPKR